MPFPSLNKPQVKQSLKSEFSKNITKEAIEAEAIASFQKSLKLQKNGMYAEAEESYLQLLKGPFLASETDSKPKNGIARTSINLKYSVYKNLGITYEKSQQLSNALDYYLMAASVDDSDVILWATIGKLAENFSNSSLTRYSYEMSQKQSTEYMPSIIRDIYVLYVTGCYEECLEMILNVLNKNKNFNDGLVVLKLMFKSVPSMREEIRSKLRDRKINLSIIDIPKEETEKIVKDIEELKQKFKSPPKPQRPIIRVSQVLSTRWQDIGKYLLNLCDWSPESDEGCYNALACDVDLERSLRFEAPLQTEVQMELESWNDQEKPIHETSINEEIQMDDATEMKVQREDQPKSDTAENSKDDKEMEICATPDNFSSQSEKKKGKKRKLSLASLFDEPEYKRRSSRVKNPMRSTETSEYSGTIKSLLPNFFHNFELKDRSNGKQENDAADLILQSSRQDANCLSFEVEEQGVMNFVKHYGGMYSLIEILRGYLMEVQQLFHLQWSKELKEMFEKCFETVKNVSKMDFCSCTSFQSRHDLVKISLVYLELRMDEILGKSFVKNKVSDNKVSGINSNSTQFTALKKRECKEEPVAEEFELNFEIQFLESVVKDDLSGQFAIRAYWVLARIYKYLNVLDDSLFYFNEALECLESWGIESIELPNLKLNNVISRVHINEVMSHVEKSCSIEGVKKIFERGEFEKVFELLEDSSIIQNDDFEGEDKRQQMLMMIESCAALGKYETCFKWIEIVFNNAIRLISKSKDKIDMAINEIKKCFNHLSPCIDQLGGNIKTQSAFARFTNNLASFLEMVFEDLDFKHSKEMENHVVSMWMLLYRLVKYQDEKVDDDDLPHHLKVIMNGHDHLGRKCWCSLNNGEYLMFVIRELNVEMDDPRNESFRSDIVSSLEQAFHCLYGHPSKKSRGRYLEEHSSVKVPLDWSGGQFLYKLFRPECLPEYDSYKTSAISSECATLLLKLKKLAPKISNFEELMAGVESYLSGTSDEVPGRLAPMEPIVEEIFYLLADFYFKNGENKKAMKYYVRDLSLYPNRLDSWAALALIHSSFLTDVLSEHDVKPDVDISLHVKPGLRSFERALGIDNTCSKLWIEYGSFTYVLQSHLSYIGDKDKESERLDMLRLSGKCFEYARANDAGSGEEWLEHYMLGKVAEKSKERPEVFLQHYLKSSEYLHLEKAKYPRRSFSYYNPPHLAVESLEMFYRMHASTVKYLVKHESQLDSIPFDVFERHLQLSGDSPLVQGTELQDKKKVSDSEDKAKLNESSIVLDEEDEQYNALNASGNHSNAESNSSDNKAGNTSVLDSEMRRDELNESKEILTIDDTFTKIQSNFETSNERNQEQMDCAEAKDQQTPNKVAIHSIDAPSRTIPNEERFSNILFTCIRAFTFILSRYPWHFKSTYRLAYLFFHCKKLRNLEACRTLLVGHNFTPISSSYKCNGLFSERKPNNFFNGLWRLPSTELDRCGSFSSHLSRSVELLCELCKSLNDPRMLFFMHQQLARCPENANKKYLRDYDREILSRQAFDDCSAVLNHQLEALVRACENKTPLPFQPQDLLLRIYNIKQQCYKISTKHLDGMMMKVYFIIFPQKIDQCPSLDEVKRFCINQQTSRVYSTSSVHQPASNINDASKQLTSNNAWNQRANIAPNNSFHRSETSERNPNETAKLNTSITSHDMEVVEKSNVSHTPSNNIAHTPIRQSSQPHIDHVHNPVASQIKNSQPVMQKQSSGVVSKIPPQNSQRQQLPVHLKLGPDVFPENLLHAKPPPQHQQFPPRTNQRMTFNHPAVEDEVIVLSEDSD